MSGNPWLDDDVPRSKGRWDDDDEEEFDPNRDPSSYMRQVIKRKEVDILQSTERSLRLIDESEQIGAATGEELLRQREVLTRTERQVDQMEEDLKQSDRHIQSIKSIWGAFMNKFKKEPATKTVKVYDENEPSRLGKAVESSKEATYQNANDYDNHPVLARQQESRQQFTQSDSAAKNEHMQQVDDNLDRMMGGLRRLKDLGLGLQEEIDSQDVIIDRLGNKVERVDRKTHETNKKLIKLNNS